MTEEFSWTATDELTLFAIDALQQGVEEMRSNGEFGAFALVETDAGRETVSFTADTHEEMLAQARDHISRLPTLARSAIAYGGVVMTRRRNWDAVLVEARERNEPYTLLLAQKYRLPSRFRPFRTIGDIRLKYGDPTGEPLW